MDDLHHLDYLDGRPSPLGSLGWTSFITWTDKLHHLDYRDGRPSLPELLGWTTFTAWSTFIAWMT
eukprot:8197729-Karenia_brevis.AAC.1